MVEAEVKLYPRVEKLERSTTSTVIKILKRATAAVRAHLLSHTRFYPFVSLMMFNHALRAQAVATYEPRPAT